MKINNCMNINSVVDSLKSKAPKIIFTFLMLCAMCSFSVFAQELDDARKRELGLMEISFFLGIGNTKSFVPKKLEYKRQTYTIYQDRADPNLSAKYNAVQKAVKILIDQGVNIPEDLRVYCTNAIEAQNVAIKRDAEWNPVATVILGPKALAPNTKLTMSQTERGGLDKPTITTIHEIGHILHERNAGDVFWSSEFRLQARTIPTISRFFANCGFYCPGYPPGSTTTATPYAKDNKKEFVAEIFAGVIIGMQFPQEVLEEYEELGGPKIPSLRYFIGRDW